MSWRFEWIMSAVGLDMRLGWGGQGSDGSANVNLMFDHV